MSHDPAHQSDDHKPVIGEFDAPKTSKRHGKGTNTAADLIRQKIDKLYKEEPNATQELAETAVITHRSKHQQFMYDLSTSGKSLAEIQTEWHNYYVNLPDDAKHEVWQEFYQANGQLQQAQQDANPTVAVAETVSPAQPDVHRNPIITAHEDEVAAHHATKPVVASHKRTTGQKRNRRQIKDHIVAKVTESAKKTSKHQGFRSAAFGLSMGVVMILVLLFGLFNELVVTPFIQPNRNADATPIIFTGDTVAASTEPQVIIPKINVQIPVDYSVPSNDENTIQTALNDAVVHYPNTSKPGEQGNVAIFGHSSNNIFNQGKYKFAFVLLSEMKAGDVFYLTNNGKTYAYKVFQTKIVEPTETWVLNPVSGKTATAALITCDPPGTSLRRLVVWGEQISPDPNGNSASVATADPSTKPTSIASNGPTLFGRFVDWLNPSD